MSRKARSRTYQKFKSPETVKTALGAIGQWMIDESKRSGEPVNRGYKEDGVSPDGQLWKNYQRNRIPLDRPDSRATILIQIAHEAVRTKFKSSANELDQLGVCRNGDAGATSDRQSLPRYPAQVSRHISQCDNLSSGPTKGKI